MIVVNKMKSKLSIAYDKEGILLEHKTDSHRGKKIGFRLSCEM